MHTKGFDLQLCANIKDGISRMRINLEKNMNPNTQRKYKSGCTLSQILSKLKIPEKKCCYFK